MDDQFAILKVGPALTFAFREAVFALAHIEAEWLADRAGVGLSGLIEKVEAAMLADPASWAAYYRGTQSELALARKYSRLDRIRYYWNVPDVAHALERLLANLEQYPPLPTLVSQYFPAQRRDFAAGSPANQPRELIRDHIMETLRDYAWACGQLNDGQP